MPGFADGQIKVYNSSGKLHYQMKTEGLPCEDGLFTSLRWKPNAFDPNSHLDEEQQRVARASYFTTITSTGVINQWQAASCKAMSTIETSTPLFALDYASDASTFAVAGEDRHIYVYNEKTKKQVCKPMFSNGLKVAEHER